MGMDWNISIVVGRLLEEIVIDGNEIDYEEREQMEEQSHPDKFAILNGGESRMPTVIGIELMGTYLGSGDRASDTVDNFKVILEIATKKFRDKFGKEPQVIMHGAIY